MKKKRFYFLAKFNFRALITKMVFFGGDGGSFFLFHLMSNGIGFGLLEANEPIEKKRFIWFGRAKL